MKTSYKKGFTLIELLVVIAIIGILSSIVLASLNSARKKGRDARRVADIKQIQLALELYYDAHSNYPTSAQYAANLVSEGFISAVPVDPLSILSYAYEAIGSGTTCSSYHLGAKLETTGHSALSADIDYNAVLSSQCIGGTWAGNADIAAANGGFNGGTDGVVYDVRP
ncbi:prepilin-type N-terminal cleavage/methylation domain-containing protein [Candidatus Kaiserbacteria bacterium]|nr:prepilin-type N-terminal cleavage/methylation domain-containing protein [Candidatus Kaiserbacteria bacterium]